MELVKKYSVPNLIKKLVGQKVKMTSNCEFFPNFNITGKVLSYYMNGTELVFKVKTIPSQKTIDVGCNMKNLKFSIIKG